MDPANLTRLAKSASEWTSNELEAYNIVVQEQTSEHFFGGTLPEYTGPPGFVQSEYLPANGADAESKALFKALDLAKMVNKGEASAVADFTAEVLRATGYEGDQTSVHIRKTFRLFMCGKDVDAMADVCLVDSTAGVRLVVEEDKSHLRLTEGPEVQVIAEAIAAFQENNIVRAGKSLVPLKEATIFGITMYHSSPKFYKIKVTEELDYALRHGLYPATTTTVYRHTPRVPRGTSEGMWPLDNRKVMMRCFEAFKPTVLQSQRYVCH